MDDNLLRMQQEAMERVRQMQARARRFVEEDTELGPKPDPSSTSSVGLPPDTKEKGEDEQTSPTAMIPKKKGGLLENFGKDQDQLFLLLIAVLLVRNDAPIELILAILYIAL